MIGGQIDGEGTGVNFSLRFFLLFSLSLSPLHYFCVAVSCFRREIFKQFGGMRGRLRCDAMKSVVLRERSRTQPTKTTQEGEVGMNLW